jgi:hypothetical protein
MKLLFSVPLFVHRDQTIDSISPYHLHLPPTIKPAYQIAILFMHVYQVLTTLAIRVVDLSFPKNSRAELSIV